MAKCRNVYRLPLKRRDILAMSVRKSPAHTGSLKHSMDFGCDEGTRIYTARGGTVAYVKDDSNVGGPRLKYWDMGNRIVVRHSNGEYTAYEHLRFRGARVRIGQAVRTGQFIGYSGNTGYTFGPHLHFEVFNRPNADESEGETLRVGFGNLRENS